MASNTTAKPSSGSPSTDSLNSPVKTRHRPPSLSLAVNPLIEQERLASTLEQIHSSASQSDILTTFTDLDPPPENANSPDQKTSAGEIVQQGFSGLYSRFREAVGVGGPLKSASELDGASGNASLPDKNVESRTVRSSVSSLAKDPTPGSTPSREISIADDSLSAISPSTADARTGLSSRVTSNGRLSSAKSQGSGRTSLALMANPDYTPEPIVTNTTAMRDNSRNTLRTQDSSGPSSSKRQSLSRLEMHGSVASLESPTSYEPRDPRLPLNASRDDASSYEGSVDASASPAKTSAPVLPPLQTRHVRSPSVASTLLSIDSARRKPAVIDRISRSQSPAYTGSRESSRDRSTAAPSYVSTAAHRSSAAENNAHRRSASAQGPDDASGQMNAQLDRMRRQVLSKEFWMKDDTVKECFLCQTPFSAFRRKHHCRTCGCIFDSKCTTVISGDKFGVQGSLRVCKRCLDVISRRMDGSGSDDSGDEQSFMPRFFGTGHGKTASGSSHAKGKEVDSGGGPDVVGESRPVTTPMMAIPATRRVKDSNRTSAVLEFDAPQLSRPGSSRSLKSLAAGRPHSSAGHKRHHSKHGNFHGRYRTTPEHRAPFRKGIEEENAKKSRFPAFHEDNIIDPELAEYMSDESSGEEQDGIFATMASGDMPPQNFDQDRSTYSPFVTGAKRHRHKAGEKSISGMSYMSRGGLGDDFSGPASLVIHRRPNNRRRNMSVASVNMHYLPSPRPKSAILKGPSHSTEVLWTPDTAHPHSQLTRSESVQYRRSSKVELNKASLKHVDNLLRQLLEDAEIPQPAAWTKALVPILLRSTDDVDPDVAKGETMDIRHYVKLKRIPGGKPGDTSYVSGVVFTKNLALKSMPRKIKNPRIALVTFPIEYQRHQQHFMSLQPVLEQEKEFLRIVVQRITNLRPQVLLAEKTVSGVALQYLSEANISVAYNVKHTVIEAVSRCSETEIISSLDMLALPLTIGRCSLFEVRTFVNNDYPGRKKSYIFLSGCKPDLGCTIALRGTNNATLAKVKQLTEFMMYVVYNLKLESSLLNDESVEPVDDGESLSSSIQAPSELSKSLNNSEVLPHGPTVVLNHPSENEQPSQVSQETADSLSYDAYGEPDEGAAAIRDSQQSQDLPKAVAMHEAHTGEPPETQFPDDVPMPTFYSDMVAKYETKLLSASPYVKFAQPHLLMKAREQERRLLYLRKLRDHDLLEDTDEKAGSQPFQLIQPEMVEEIGQKAPKQIMEILHAVHDAEYDKALFNYDTQTRHWETHIQGNLDLFDPFSHQNIVLLYSVVCTNTKIPCIEPIMLAINFYDEQHIDTGFDPDCTLGQFIEDMVYSKDETCTSNGCEQTMGQHHKTYVHDQSRLTIFVEPDPSTEPRDPDLGDGITMWSYCKICKKDSEEKAMSDATYKYSFAKYLELLYWGRGLRMKGSPECSHDHHHDHVRYFSLDGSRVRIHRDPIDLLEIVVPRPRITWKVANDLQLKNKIFSKMDERWDTFMASVKARLKSIRIDSVLPEKADGCRADIDALVRKALEDKKSITSRLQEIYVNTKYYEVVPFNVLVREMLEKAGEWDQAFAKFEADFLGDKDMRQLTMMQLKKMFTDNESKESLVSQDGTASTSDSAEPPSQTFSEADEKSTQPTEFTAEQSLEASTTSSAQAPGSVADEDGKVSIDAEEAIERIDPLDLAGSPTLPKNTSQSPPPVPGHSSSRASSPVETRPPASPLGQGRSPTESAVTGPSLTEKVDQLRREQCIHLTPSSIEPFGTPVAEDLSSPQDRTVSRRPGAPAPMIRAISQPVRPLSRTSSFKPMLGKDSKGTPIEHAQLETQPEGSVKVDKKLSERLGLTALKNRGKATASGIPRYVHKKRESKVTTLAKHFEQLSREFERERIRDRKQRAATLTQPRAMLPRTATRAIVEVYDDLKEAFEEPAQSTELNTDRDSRKSVEATERPVEPTEQPEPTKADAQPEPAAAADNASQTDMSSTKVDSEETTNVNTSQAFSDDEGASSDVEPAVSDEFLPGLEQIADSLEPSTEIPLELPKHQKTSLMKYLTNFWAERSASGWPPLVYPVNPTDHIFVDSDIIVREDEPSSVIALALNSEDYKTKLARIRQDAQDMIDREVDIDGGSDGEPTRLAPTQTSDRSKGRSHLEQGLLRATGTHLKYQFKEGAAIMTCKIFYAEQFDALRRKCGVAERVVESLSRCLKWDSKGGKTKSVFLKTLDDRLVLKSLSPIETSAFLRFAPGYFNIMALALFHELPSCIAKMLGFFQVLIKNPVTGTDVKLDLLVTENLFYDRSPSRIFDLKGSMRNRKIESTGDQNEVLLDENMVEYIYESPLFAREHSKKLLSASVWNDTLFLARQNVMDYSLMIAVDEARKELVVGIIDCIRTYTWDKKLESWIKDRGFAGGGRNRPTVTSPKEYKSRFREAMARYILQAPNCWHLFNHPNYPQYYGRARFEEGEMD